MKEFETYYLLEVAQGSPDWHYLRKGRITASNLGKIMGCAPYCDDTPEVMAQHFVGIKKEEHTKEAEERMNLGNDYEPIIRDYLCKYLKCDIKETGFAIWKKDKRFGASLDGIIDNDTGIEIKCPRRMYKPLLRYMDKKDEDRKEDDYSHIWKSHYYQMLMNGVVTGRKNMIYAVYSIEDEEIFIQNIKVNYEEWEKEVYPRAVAFYEKYMAPLVTEETKNKIKLQKEK
jgi:putative phage-type endonuclease